VFLGGVAKVNPILVIELRNANHAFLAPLLVMDLKPPYLVIALRNANKHFWRHCRDGLKTSSLGDCAEKCQHPGQS
jgi:hypothetical protein